MDHKNKPPIVINLCESMSYLTEVADPVKMLEDPFIKHNWHYIVALSKAKEAVDLLHRSDDGKWDKSSWNGKDYEPFAVNVIQCICIHSSHQQRCENYVQLCGLLALTGVGEVRRTCRAIINSVINQCFNSWAAWISKKQREADSKKPVERVKGQEKIALFLEFIYDFFVKCDKGMAVAPDGLLKRIENRLGGLSSKASVREKEAKVDKFES